jgi:beta-1,4-mannosyl-glycoprotein beta-1,4-N-acetylglucosaminyltransferase
MKIFDCFTFFNEIDLLEFRLKLLDPFVDHFVLTESNVTFSGKYKPYYFEQNRGRYTKWLHKIIYIQAKQSVDGMTFVKDGKSYNPESDAWKLENGLRNFLAEAKHRIADNDRVIISDLDEIPNPFVVQKIKNLQEPRALSLLFHYYFLNCQNIGYERWWKGSIVCTGKQFNEVPPQHFRDNRHVFRAIPEAGWHFSFLGGPEKIKYKIQSFAHLEFAKEEFWNDENILQSMEKGEDVFRRPGVKYRFFPLSYYPPFLRKMMLEYPTLLHLKKNNQFTDFYYRIRRKIKGQHST